MKTVLFCGGRGMRLFPSTENIPKPLVKVGDNPLIWNLMKYYAHYGHKEFILCLGHQGDVIRRAFQNHQEFPSSDSASDFRGNSVEHLGSNVSEWEITFVDTGTEACIGERLVAVRQYLEDEDVFLANYADGVTDLHLPAMLENFCSAHTNLRAGLYRPHGHQRLLR